MGFSFNTDFNKQVEEGFLDQGFPVGTARQYDFSDLNRGDALLQGVKNEGFTYQAVDSSIDWISDFIDPKIKGINKMDHEFTTTSDEWSQKLSQLTPDGKALFMQYGPQNEVYANIAYKDAAEFDRQQAYLQSLGYEGMGYRLVGALTDLPATLAIAPETGGGSLAGWYARTARILNSSFASRSLTGATIEGLMELGRQNMSKEERDDFNLILSVGLGAIARGTFVKSPDAELNRLGTKLLDDAAKGKDVTKLLSQLKTSFSGQGLDNTIEKLQYDLASVTHKANSPTFRDFGKQMYYQRTGEEGINRGEGKIALEETKDMLEHQLYNNITHETRPVMASIAKLAKRGVFKTLRAHWDPKFQQSINEVMADLQLGKLFDPDSSMDELLKSAQNKLMGDLGLTADEALTSAKQLLRAAENVSEKSHDILRKAGTEAFQDMVGNGIPKTKDYMPVVHDAFKIKDLIRTHGKVEVRKFFEKAISNAMKKNDIPVNASKTKAVATALLNKMSKSEDMGFLTKMDPAALKIILREEASLTDEQADLITTLIGRPKEGASEAGSKYEKTRGIFDYATKYKTDRGATISFRDTISNNFEASWFPYSRTQAGYNALEKLGLKTSKARIEHRALIKKELESNPRLDADEIEKEMRIYDETMLELEGKPLSDINPFGRGAQALRSVKNMNIARYLGQTFWTMSAELGSATWNAGLPHMMRSLPMMKQLIRQFSTGKLDDELMQELYTHIGLMGDLNRGVGFSKYEHDFAHIPVAGSAAASRQGFLNKFEKISDQFKEAALMAGGIKPLTAFFEAATSTGIITKMMKAADGKKIKGGFETTLKEMGFTGKTRNLIFNEMRKNIEVIDHKVYGKGIKKLNLDKWDPEVRDIFTTGVKRMTNTIVQRTTLGDKVGVLVGNKLIQNTVVGKLALELKGYVITAWSKQLGRALTRRDLYSLGMLSTQMALGSLAYMAQVYTNYPNDPKKRAELLQPENIAKTTFARSSMASWLPQIIDSGSLTKLYEPQFKQARSSGLASDFVNGMPAVDLFNSALALPNLPAALSGYGDVSPTELKQALRLVPLNNAFGIRGLMESVVSDYKEGRSRQQNLRGF